MKSILKQSETPVPGVTDASVQADRHQSLTAQTPVSDATDSSVCETSSRPLRTCLCCLRELPDSHFYAKNKQNEPDSYCKDCRKTMSRQRRKKKVCPPEKEDAPPLYPVITRIGQPEVRMHLILNALQTVRDNALRKCRKRHTEEFLQETGLTF